eukprot:6803087-Alexandrium_andersonii.AAC.1
MAAPTLAGRPSRSPAASSRASAAAARPSAWSSRRRYVRRCGPPHGRGRACTRTTPVSYTHLTLPTICSV